MEESISNALQDLKMAVRAAATRRTNGRETSRL